MAPKKFPLGKSISHYGAASRKRFVGKNQIYKAFNLSGPKLQFTIA
jgi:hypothetical protein